MFNLNLLDLSNGITFTAIDSRDVDKVAEVLITKGVNFTRSHASVPVILTDGTEVTAQAESLAIDPVAGTAYVLSIYQKLMHG